MAEMDRLAVSRFTPEEVGFSRSYGCHALREWSFAAANQNSLE
jgi:hypothetical protein